MLCVECLHLIGQQARTSPHRNLEYRLVGVDHDPQARIGATVEIYRCRTCRSRLIRATVPNTNSVWRLKPDQER